MSELFVLLVIVGVFLALIKDIVSPAVAFLVALVVLVVAGILPASEAFKGFSNENLVTIGALFVVARAIETNINVGAVTKKIFGTSKSIRLGLLRMTAPVALSSAFVNNTPIVAMLINPIIQWSKSNKLPSSKFLIPLSYAAIFGGALTLIGTSTNLVVSGLLSDSGLESFSFFELTPYGLPVAAVGLLTIILLAPKLIPTRGMADLSSSEIEKKFTLDMIPTKQTIGKTVARANLRKLKDAYLVEIVRSNGDVISPVSPKTTIRKDDVLRFSGNADSLISLNAHSGVTAIEHKHTAVVSGNSVYVEAVIGHNRAIVGHTLAEIGFRAKYQAAVLAVFRAGETITGSLGSVVLKPGDSLLLVGDESFVSRWQSRSDFLYMRQIGKAFSNDRSGLKKIGLIVLVIAALLISGAPLSIATLGGALASILFNIHTLSSARESIDFDLLIMIASAIGVAKGVELSGLANQVSSGIVSTFDGFGAVGLLFGVILATTILTEVVTNAAAALLVFPIALATAQQAGLDPRMFAIAIAITASLSFISPLGYQTNTMVYSTGAYKFHDFMKLGLVLNVVSAILLTALLSLSFGLSF